MQNHSQTVLTALYPGKTFRFSLYPENPDQFKELPFLESDQPYEKITVHKDAQGMIIAKKKDYRFVMDPPTGNFRFNGSRGEIISGIVQSGEFTSNSIFIRKNKNDRVYGFGAASGKPHLNNEKFRLLNLDTLMYSIPGASYSSFPFFILKKENSYTGIFLASSCPMDVHIDSDGIKPYGSGVYINIDERVQKTPITIFILQGSISEILEKYSVLTGFPCRLPAWALGYHQSRWSYSSQEDVIAVAEKFRSLKIPCDAIHLDIDYMDTYRNFTWNKKKFPSPDKMNQKLSRLDMKSVCIVDPGISSSEDFYIYKEGHDRGFFCKTSDREEYTGRVWGGKTVFPDFTDDRVREWFAKKHQILFENGVSGIWNDMNDPVLKLGKRYDPLKENIVHEAGPHIEMRNLYANYQAESTKMAFRMFKPDEREFILTRSGFPGIQKHAVIWTGDNHHRWKHLKENLHMVIHLGLSGMPFCGADTGGFAGGPGRLGLFLLSRDKELYARWMELGSLMPYFRGHSVKFSKRSEPWMLGEEVLEISKKHIQRRYSLMHYIYNLMLQAHASGSPLVRPVFYEFPGMDPDLCENMFMLGPSLLAVPVMKKGMREITFHLPPGNWHDFETGKLYSGDTACRLPCDPGRYPLFVRAGTILPLCIPEANAELSMKNSLIIEIHPGKNMETTLLLDDGRSAGKENMTLRFNAEKDSSQNIRLQIDAEKNGYSPQFKNFTIRLPASYKIMTSDKKITEGKNADLSGENRSQNMMSYDLPLKNQSVEFIYEK